MQAWKVGFLENGGIALIELEIPDDAKRLEYGNNILNKSGKCDFADVVSIKAMAYGEREYRKAYSAYDFNFVYKPGTRVYADRFDENPVDECTPGIHYFYFKGAAAAYSLTGWFRKKQERFWLNLQDKLIEEYKGHYGLMQRILIMEG